MVHVIVRECRGETTRGRTSCVFRVVSGKFTVVKSVQWQRRVVITDQSDVANDSELTVGKSCWFWRAQSHSQRHCLLADYLQQTCQRRLENTQSTI